jgi:hypothetical protein
MRLYAETVRGSSYPPQIRHRIEHVQAPFESWFQSKTGIGPLRALQILDAFETASNANFQVGKRLFNELQLRISELGDDLLASSVTGSVSPALDSKRDKLGAELSCFMEEAPLVLPVAFDQVALIMPGLGKLEWESLRGLIGLTPESRQNLEQPRDIKDRPLYFLTGDRFIFIDVSCVYDALFGAFDALTRTDMVFRDVEYMPNLSRWMESEVAVYLRRLFPQSLVFEQLNYPDPDKPGAETELDAAVIWGPFCILVEVKGKQFRPKSRLGDPSHLKTDLKRSIEEAFDQARRAIRFIDSAASVTFTEKNTKRKLVLKKGDCRRIFPISITLHHFDGLATQLASLKRLGLFRDSSYPWSVSLADLDVITQFAGSPDVFLHYIQRRLDLQRSEKRIQGLELDLFGLYLENRLHPSEIWERKTSEGQEFSSLMALEGSEKFDQWFQSERSQILEKPDIRLLLPPRFSALIEELRRRDDDGARWIAFSLLGLSRDTVESIETELLNLRVMAKPDRRMVRLTVKEGDLVVSVVAALGLSKDELRTHTALRANIEKYRLKAGASLALGINVADSRSPFSFACWFEGDWQQDPVMDEIIGKERPKLLPGQKLPGRNELCFCGSGNKFKKCCLGKASALPLI